MIIRRPVALFDNEVYQFFIADFLVMFVGHRYWRGDSKKSMLPNRLIKSDLFNKAAFDADIKTPCYAPNELLLIIGDQSSGS